MAWIYLAVSEESHSLWNHGSGPSPIVKTTDTLRRSCSHECETEGCPLRRSGMTCERSREICCQKSISFLEDFPVKTSALQDMVSAWAAVVQVYSGKFTDSLKSSDQDSYSWKTSRRLELEGLMPLRKHLPNYGMIVDGRLFQPPKLEPVTSGKGGSCLPTPTASPYGFNQTESPNAKRRLSLDSMSRRGVIPTPMARDWKGGGGANRKSPDLPFTMGGALSPSFVEEIMGYSTGWTELNASATQWFRSKQEKHLKNSLE